MHGKKALREIGLISLVTSLIGILWLFLPVRISNPEWNQAVALCTIWGVFLGLGVAGAIFLNRKWVRVVAAVPFGILCVLYVLALAISMVAGGPLVGYEIMDSVDLNPSKIVAYRTNGGATTDFGIRISHELFILPGIVLVKDLHNGYHEYTATLKVVRPGTVVATINNRPPIEYSVRPFIYF